MMRIKIQLDTQDDNSAVLAIFIIETYPVICVSLKRRFVLFNLVPVHLTYLYVKHRHHYVK